MADLTINPNDPNDPAAPLPPGVDLTNLDLAHPSSAFTANVMKQRMVTDLKQNQEQESRIREAAPVVKALQLQKAAIDNTFVSEIQPVLDAQDQAFKRKEAISRLPGGLANLVGMFNKDWNEGRQDAIISAGNNQMVKKQLMHEVQASAITTQANAIKEELGLNQQALANEQQATQNLISTYNASLTAEQNTKAKNVSYLKSIGTDKLQKMLKDGNYKAPDGAVYEPDEIEAAREQRITFDMNNAKLSAETRNLGLEGDAKVMANRETALKNMVSTLSPGEYQDMIDKAKNGVVKIGDVATTTDKLTQLFNADMLGRKEVQQKLSAIAANQGQIGVDAETNSTKARVIMGLTGGKVDENGEIIDPGWSENAIKLAQVNGQSDQIAEVNKKIKNFLQGKTQLDAQTAAALSPQSQSNMVEAVKLHKTILDDTGAKVLEGMDAELKPAVQERLNSNGFITDDMSAAKALIAVGGRNDGIEAFGGFRADLQDTWAPVMKEITDRFNSVAGGGEGGERGKNKAGSEAMMRVMLNPSFTPGAGVLVPRLNESLKKFGGLKNAVISHDLEYVSRVGMLQVKNELGEKADKVLGDIINPDGSWTPRAAAAIKDQGIERALPNMLAAADAEVVASGGDSGNNPTGAIVLKSLQDKMAKQQVKIPNGSFADTSTAGWNKIVYNNKPEVIFAHKMGKAVDNYNTVFSNALRGQQLKMSNSVGFSQVEGGTAVVPTVGNQPSADNRRAIDRLITRRMSLGLPELKSGE